VNIKRRDPEHVRQILRGVWHECIIVRTMLRETHATRPRELRQVSNLSLVHDAHVIRDSSRRAKRAKRGVCRISYPYRIDVYTVTVRNSSGCSK
jgi:hypothetical protein